MRYFLSFGQGKMEMELELENGKVSEGLRRLRRSN
jgi:hypothetical protein